MHRKFKLRGSFHSLLLIYGASVVALSFNTAAAQTAAPSSSSSSDIKATPDQARSFIVNMVEQHGSISCSPAQETTSPIAKTDVEMSVLAKMDGDHMAVQTSEKIAATYKKGFSDRTNAVDVHSFLLSEVRFTVAAGQSERRDRCAAPVLVLIACKAGDCVRSTHNVKGANDSTFELGKDTFKSFPLVIDGSTQSSAVGFFLNDNDVARRLVRAVQFYQAHSPTENSPF